MPVAAGKKTPKTEKNECPSLKSDFKFSTNTCAEEILINKIRINVNSAMVMLTTAMMTTMMVMKRWCNGSNY